MIPESLIEAIADEGRAITALAPAVSIDPLELLKRDINLETPGLWSPNRHCRLVKAADGWIAVNLARETDREAVPAWLECTTEAAPWDMVISLVSDRKVAELIERAVLLGLPIAKVGETQPIAQPSLDLRSAQAKGMSVIDLSALWAGPLCGALLAEAGMAVTKVEDPARPDPTGQDQKLNGRKRRLSLPLNDPALLEAIYSADIVITSARQHALARLGVTRETLFASNPALIWIAITAHGFDGTGTMRIGFGDDCAAAGGLVAWNAGEPRFLGDALADPLTGMTAARQALECVAAGQSGLVDVALAPAAAAFAISADIRASDSFDG